MSTESKAPRKGPARALWAVGAIVLLAAFSLGGVLGGRRWERAHRPPVPGPVVTARDTNGDGRPDRWEQRENGVLLQVEIDRNRDGRADRVDLYGSDGRVVRVDWDEDFNGRFDRYDSMTRDGHIVLTHYDRDWDGLPERWVQWGGNGVVVSEWTDQDEDTAPERYREFDGQGTLMKEAFDRDSDGLYELQHSFNTHWGTEHPQSIEHDDDRDGQFETRQVFDRQGHLRFVQSDTDHDGVRDTERFVDAAGNTTRELHDRDGDGNYEEWRYPQPDGTVRVGFDSDVDLELDRWDPPGPPPGWCQARCPGVFPAATPVPRRAGENP